MRYTNSRNRGVWAYENRRQKELTGDYEQRLVEIIARFRSRCRETHRVIEVGQRILWLPGSSVVFCEHSTHWERMQARKKSLRELKRQS
jgi:hypothetical protein